MYGFPPKIIRINIGNTATKTIIKLLENKIGLIKAFLDNEHVGYLEIDWNCFLVEACWCVDKGDEDSGGKDGNDFVTYGDEGVD